MTLTAPPDEELLSVREAAVRLRVHWRTILRAIHRGQLPALKVGSQYRIKASTLAPRELETILYTPPKPRKGQDWQIPAAPEGEPKPPPPQPGERIGSQITVVIMPDKCRLKVDADVLAGFGTPEQPDIMRVEVQTPDGGWLQGEERTQYVQAHWEDLLWAQRHTVKRLEEARTERSV